MARRTKIDLVCSKPATFEKSRDWPGWTDQHHRDQRVPACARAAARALFLSRYVTSRRARPPVSAMPNPILMVLGNRGHAGTARASRRSRRRSQLGSSSIPPGIGVTRVDVLSSNVRLTTGSIRRSTTLIVDTMHQLVLWRRRNKHKSRHPADRRCVGIQYMVLLRPSRQLRCQRTVGWVRRRMLMESWRVSTICNSWTAASGQ